MMNTNKTKTMVFGDKQISSKICIDGIELENVEKFTTWEATVLQIRPIENIFARNLHMLLRIDYISTCVIHLKCTLLLEDTIS